MARNFVRADRDQPFLMPPDMREWLANDDLVWLVLDAVEQADLVAFNGVYREDGQGRPAFDPAMMVALLLYAYCHGVRSSREMERHCVRDIAFRVITGGHRPDHATIARFRARHERALQSVFTEVLRLCALAGLVQLGWLALDGTKTGADASWSANRTREQLDTELAGPVQAMLVEAGQVDQDEDQQFAETRGDELPAGLASRSGWLARLREARDRLVAEDQARRDAQQAKIDAWQARKDAGGRGPGPKPPTEPPTNQRGTVPRANATDPQARTRSSSVPRCSRRKSTAPCSTRP